MIKNKKYRKTNVRPLKGNPPPRSLAFTTDIFPISPLREKIFVRGEN